jgi:hypothetical protein
MHVQRVAVPCSRVESWTVLGDDDVLVEPVERYLAYLTAIERSPSTVKASAHDLKDYWVFLQGRAASSPTPSVNSASARCPRQADVGGTAGRSSVTIQPH